MPSAVVAWDLAYGPYALWPHSVATDSSGFIYGAGEVDGAFPGQTNVGGADVYLRKFDPSANEVWTRQFGTTAYDTANDNAGNLAVDASGNIFMAGHTYGTFPGQASAGSADVFLAKFDSQGNQLWTQQFGTAGEDRAGGVAVDPSGNVYIAADFNRDQNNGGTDIVLRKYDPQGNLLWSQVFSSPAATFDESSGIALDSLGNLYMTGSTDGAFPGFANAGGRDAFLAKFDGAGNLVWTSQWGTAGADEGFGVTADSSGNAYVVGESNSYAYAFIRKISATGNELWESQYASSGGVAARGVTILPSGDVAIAGSVNWFEQGPTNGFAAGFDPEGTQLWSVQLPSLTHDDFAQGIASDSLGNIYLHGQSRYSDGPGYGFLSKISVNEPSTLSGFVWRDFNNDGQIDFGESGISGVTVTLHGSDGSNLTTTTDTNGFYQFTALGAANYYVTATQPAGYTAGIDSVGTVNGVVTGSVSAIDQFFVSVGAGVDAINYNFGQLPVNGSAVTSGQTAGIGFWNNKNGQALIKSLNGGQNATQLGNWLAATFTNIFGANAGSHDLAGLTNAQVAAVFQQDFVVKGPKLDGQVMATALSVYVTNQTLAGTTATAYGFTVTQDGVGIATFNVGSDGAAVAQPNNTTMSVMDMLFALDALSKNDNGLLYGGDLVLRKEANDLFSAINAAGSL